MAVSESDQRAIHRALAFLLGVGAGVLFFAFPSLQNLVAYQSYDQATESTATRPWFKAGFVVGLAVLAACLALATSWFAR